MDFRAFQASMFFRVGQSRFHVFGFPTGAEHFCMYDTASITAITSNDPYIPDYHVPIHKRITPFHLRHALGLVKGHVTEPDFLPIEFREVITKQWIEVSDICNKITNDYNKNIVDSKEKLRVNIGKLLVIEPGKPVSQHVHNAKQTITMVYFFEEEKILQAENPHFLMGRNFQQKIYLPDSNKTIFTMINDPPHYVFTNKWSFWWFNDFTNYCTLPLDLPYTYWDNPYLDNKNL